MSEPQYLSWRIDALKRRPIEILWERFQKFVVHLTKLTSGKANFEIFAVVIPLPLEPDPKPTIISRDCEETGRTLSAAVLEASSGMRGGTQWMRVPGGRGYDAGGGRRSGGFADPSYVEYFVHRSDGARRQSVRLYDDFDAVVCREWFPEECYSPHWVWAIVRDSVVVAKEIFRRTRGLPQWIAVGIILVGTDRVPLRVREFPGMANYELENSSPYVVLDIRPYVFDTSDDVETMIGEMKTTLRKLYGSPGERPSLESV